MSEPWTGLHNPERHITTISGKRAMCNWEGQHNHDTWCDPVNPCYCCLAAEVEALRAREQAVRDAIEAELERHTLTNLGDFMFLDQALGRILNALDGDNDA